MSERFSGEDFAHIAKLLREDNSDHYTRALLSNNFNVILVALDIAAQHERELENEMALDEAKREWLRR